MPKACWLTTTDNRFNPFTHLDDWMREDARLGHHCSERLAEICKTSNQFTEQEEAEAIEAAIDDIIKHDPENIFIKVYEK